MKINLLDSREGYVGGLGGRKDREIRFNYIIITHTPTHKGTQSWNPISEQGGGESNSVFLYCKYWETWCQSDKGRPYLFFFTNTCFFLLLILRGFHIVSSSPTCLPISSHLLSALLTPPQIKTKLKQNKTKQTSKKPKHLVLSYIPGVNKKYPSLSLSSKARVHLITLPLLSMRDALRLLKFCEESIGGTEAELKSWHLIAKLQISL